MLLDWGGRLCAGRVVDQFGTAVLNDHRAEVGEPVAGVDVPRVVACDGDVKGEVSMSKDERVDLCPSCALEVIQGVGIEVLLAQVGGQGQLSFLATPRRPRLRKGHAKVWVEQAKGGLACA